MTLGTWLVFYLAKHKAV